MRVSADLRDGRLKLGNPFCDAYIDNVDADLSLAQLQDLCEP